MKVLLIEWKSFGNEDIADAFNQLGYTTVRFPFDNHGELHHDETIEGNLIASIEKNSPDFVFSFNYFPIISIACNKANIKYISWIYDSPQVLMYSYTIANPCNIVFTFDKSQYIIFSQNRISTVHYLPLAANTDRLSAMKDFSGFKASPWNIKADISFIGSLYTEDHQFYNRLTGISDYTRGFLEGIINTQKNIYGYNFVEYLLKEHKEIIDDMMKSLPMTPDSSSVATTEYLFAQYVINRQITALERTENLSYIGQRFSYDLYTQDSSVKLQGAYNHGKIDYYDMAPYVFKSSKINLNFTLRSIISGIPLRCFDILGAGGFLMTNYQEDFADCYVPGEDFVYYEDKEDMISKIDYYLSHESERKEIAQNGFNRTAQNHTYIQRVLEMIEYL